MSRRAIRCASPMLEGARDVQLTELCYQSDRERRWIDVPELASDAKS